MTGRGNCLSIGKAGRWKDAIRELRKAPVRPEIREERLRTTGGLRGGPAVALSAWRGRSGRRYVVMAYDIAQAGTIDAPNAVILGVRRGNNGIATLLGVGHEGTIMEGAELAAADGANELHIHRLADTHREREAIVADLSNSFFGADSAVTLSC